mmetsp:Transcript_4113/g.12756  ORF Transcript_4113/g.12756 Transcript_4113/m.12756 type:complete len:468 (+) Transcript_4113:989-2392(+)
MTARSVSTTSSSSAALASRTKETFFSATSDAASSSFSSAWKAISMTCDSFCKSAWSAAWRPKSSFKRVTSARIDLTCDSTEAACASCCSSDFRSCSRFSPKMRAWAFSSAARPSVCSVACVACTRLVWSANQEDCKAVTSKARASRSFDKLRIVASNGPTDSPSSARSVIFSCFRLRRSTRYIFFSMSSFRWRISVWYFAINSSWPRSLRSKTSSVEPSCELCASVFKASTRTRASSLSRCAWSISRSWPSLTATCAAFRRLRTALVTVVDADRAAAIFVSTRWRSCVTVWMFWPSWASESPLFLPSAATRASSRSVCSMDRWSNWNCAATAPHSARSLAAASSSAASSRARRSRTARSASASPLALPASRRVPSISVCRSWISVRACCSVDAAAARASSRRVSWTSAAFHCCKSCFFSKAMRSISCAVSASMPRASLDSPCCLRSCDSCTAMDSERRCTRSSKESM